MRGLLSEACLEVGRDSSMPELNVQARPPPENLINVPFWDSGLFKLHHDALLSGMLNEAALLVLFAQSMLADIIETLRLHPVGRMSK